MGRPEYKRTIREGETPARQQAFPLLRVMQLTTDTNVLDESRRETQLIIPPRVPLPAHMRNTVTSSFVSEPRARFMAKETARRIRK